MLSIPRIFLAVVSAAVIVVVAAGTGWWFFIREDNELATNAPEIPQDLRQDGTAPASGGLTFRIIPDRSEAAYFVDEKLASLPVPSTAKGTTKDIEGEFSLTADGFGLDTSKPSRFTVNLVTLKSDQERRDTRLHENGLETARFPTATFTPSSVGGFDSDIPAGEEHSFQLTGMLDLHGVQKEVTWDVQGRRDGNVITALATVTFLFSDFDIPVLNVANFVSVTDDVTLQVQVVAQAP